MFSYLNKQQQQATATHPAAFLWVALASAAAVQSRTWLVNIGTLEKEKTEKMDGEVIKMF